MSKSIGSEWLRDCTAERPSLASHYRPSKVFLRKAAAYFAKECG